MSPSEPTPAPGSESAFQQHRKALQEFVRAHVPPEQQLPISRLIASYVAESVRQDRRQQEAKQRLVDGVQNLKDTVEQFLRRNHSTPPTR